VPRAQREQIALFQFETTAEFGTAPSTSLPPIERFLDSGPSIPLARTREPDEATVSEKYAEEDELPPVEHFLDPLPAVEDFAADAEVGSVEAAMEYPPPDAPIGESSADEWVETDWQQYDWRSAAALGESGENEASTAWSTTDWDAGMPRAKEPRPTPAQAIASALDQIAQRIRDGELALPTPEADPQAIAAKLAALLGIRR